MKNHLRYWRVVCAAVVMLLLSGCGSNISRDVTLYSGGKWTADIQVSVPAESQAMIGSEQQLEQAVADLVAGFEQQGARVNWKSRSKDGELIYDMTVKGEGMELLNNTVFEGRAVINLIDREGEQEIRLAYSASPDLWTASQNSMTINGAEVLYSNGEQLGRGSVYWQNARDVKVNITPKKNSLFYYLLIPIVIAAVGAGLLLLRRKRKKQVHHQPQINRSPAPVASAPVKRPTFCTNCGKNLIPEAKFCPYCGKSRT